MDVLDLGIARGRPSALISSAWVVPTYTEADFDELSVPEREDAATLDVCQPKRQAPARAGRTVAPYQSGC